MSLSENIYEARGRLGMTQQELAAKAGVTAQTIKNWEQGKTDQPHSSALAKVAFALGVTVKQLREK